MSEIGGFVSAAATVWTKWMAGMSWQIVLVAGLAGILALAMRRSSASARYAVWLLVFVKLMLPPMFATPWSLGRLAERLPLHLQIVGPTTGGPDAAPAESLEPNARAVEDGGPYALSVPGPEDVFHAASGADAATPLSVALMLVWLVVAALLFLAFLHQWRKYARRLKRDRLEPPPAVVEAIESLRVRLHVRYPVASWLSNEVATPTLLGVWRPAIVLPARFAHRIEPRQLAHVIAHELAHVKRRDLLLAWFTAFLACLYWFHPVVWLVHFHLRREREMACDDMVLRLETDATTKDYASTLLRMAESYEGSIPAAAGFLGLFEQSDNLLQRIRAIADPRRSRAFGLGPAVAVCLLALLMPMGANAVDNAEESAEKEIAEYYAQADDEVKDYIRQTARTFGPVGLWLPGNHLESMSDREQAELKRKTRSALREANKALPGEPQPNRILTSKELTEALAAAGLFKDESLAREVLGIATFMQDKQVDNRARWLAVAALGRQGHEPAVPALISLLDHPNQNTRIWARASLVRITGQHHGADKRAWATWWNNAGKEPRIDVSAIKQVDPQPVTQSAPELVETVPAIGAEDVDPGLTEITVTFDQDMGGGFSWTGGGEQFPKTTGKPHWVNGRTCALPVALEPGKAYRVGINSTSHKNFRGVNGAPARNRVLHFVTAGEGAPRTEVPVVVTMSPSNGATGVDPKTPVITVTFNVPMGGGFSWTGGGDSFPETTGKPYWSDDHKTCYLPVSLRPNKSYRFGLNSPSHVNFQSTNGIPLEPVACTFTTGG